MTETETTTMTTEPTIHLTWTSYLTSSGRWSGPHAFRPGVERCSAGPLRHICDQEEELGEVARGVDALCAAMAMNDRYGAHVVVGVALITVGGTVPWATVLEATRIEAALGFLDPRAAARDVVRLLPEPMRSRAV